MLGSRRYSGPILSATVASSSPMGPLGRCVFVFELWLVRMRLWALHAELLTAGLRWQITGAWRDEPMAAQVRAQAAHSRARS